MLESSFKAIVDAASEGVLVFVGTSLQFFNTSLMEMTGYRADELEDKTVADFIHPDDLGLVMSNYRNRCEGRKFIKRYECRYMKKDGTSRWGKMDVAQIQWKGAIGVVIFVEDITDRKRAEKELRESEERFRTLYTASFGGIGIHDNGAILDANQGLTDITGYEYTELIGMDVYQLAAPGWREYVKTQIESGNNVPYNIAGLRKDGSTCALEIRGKIIPYHGRAACVTEFRDISERQRMEEEIHRMRQMESLGILAGGIAHDFNNILTVLLGNISLITKADLSRDDLFKNLSDAEAAIYRAKELTAQLLTFAQGNAPVRSDSSIKAIITSSVEFILRGARITYRLDFANDLRMASVDRSQISQVIQNLVLNAKDAMPNGGILDITAENTDAGLAPLPPGNYIRIRISDNGNGISETTIRHIFEPYFTTKPEGHGLGLAIVYSVVKKHGGHISVESSPGAGSVFTVLLPASANADTPVELKETNTSTGAGRVLIMDDEEIIRSMAADMLHMLGYDAEQAFDGDEALRMYGNAFAAGRRYDAVIMDLTVPEGNGGKEVIGRLLEMDPSAVAIVSSGYSNDPVMASFRDYGFRGVLAKPYGIDELGEVLQHVCGNRYAPGV